MNVTFEVEDVKLEEHKLDETLCELVEKTVVAVKDDGQNFRFSSIGDNIFHFSSDGTTKAKKSIESERELIAAVNKDLHTEYNTLLIRHLPSGADGLQNCVAGGELLLVSGCTRKLRLKDAKTRRIIVRDFEVVAGTGFAASGNFLSLFNTEIAIQRRIKEAATVLVFSRHDPAVDFERWSNLTEEKKQKRKRDEERVRVTHAEQVFKSAFVPPPPNDDAALMALEEALEEEEEEERASITTIDDVRHYLMLTKRDQIDGGSGGGGGGGGGV